MGMWTVIIVIFVLGVLSTGIGLFVWWKLKPKQMIWNALVYQLGDGVMPPIINKGEVVANYRLSELKPYTKDTIVKKISKGGAPSFMLSKLKKATPVVTADCVENWGKEGKVVSVLLHGDTATLLKIGYERKIASKIFTPLPSDRIMMIKTEMADRKERLEDTNKLLQQLPAYITTVLWILGMVVITYFSVEAVIPQATINQETATQQSDAQMQIANLYIEALQCNVGSEGNVKKEEPPTIPP